MLHRRLAPLASVPVLAAVLAAVVAPGPAAATTTEPGGNAPEGTVAVFAAASLTDAFTAIGAAYEAEYPAIDVELNFAASSELVGQILEGAAVDVFASADTKNMDKLVEADLGAGGPATFATNSLMIIVEPGNPLGIDGVEDLADPDLVVVTCDPEVPIGAYSQQLFVAAGIEVTPDSLEENVRSIVTKVVEGEADAGVVYATDVSAAGDAATGVAIPAELNVVAEYPIAALVDAPNADGGAGFVEFVLGTRGQEILADFGFGAPDLTATDAPATSSATTGG